MRRFDSISLNYLQLLPCYNTKQVNFEPFTILNDNNNMSNEMFHDPEKSMKKLCPFCVKQCGRKLRHVISSNGNIAREYNRHSCFSLFLIERKQIRGQQSNRE